MLFILVPTLAVGIAVGAMGYQVLSVRQAQVTRTEILRTDLAGIAGRDGMMSIPEIAPGARGTRKTTTPPTPSWTFWRAP